MLAGRGRDLINSDACSAHPASVPAANGSSWPAPGFQSFIRMQPFVNNKNAALVENAVFANEGIRRQFIGHLVGVTFERRDGSISSIFRRNRPRSDRMQGHFAVRRHSGLVRGRRLIGRSCLHIIRRRLVNMRFTRVFAAARLRTLEDKAIESRPLALRFQGLFQDRYRQSLCVEIDRKIDKDPCSRRSVLQRDRSRIRSPLLSCCPAACGLRQQPSRMLCGGGIRVG